MRISDWSSDVCSSDLPFFLSAAQEEGRCFDRLSTNGKKGDADLWPVALKSLRSLRPLRESNSHRRLAPAARPPISDPWSVARRRLRKPIRSFRLPSLPNGPRGRNSQRPTSCTPTPHDTGQ